MRFALSALLLALVCVQAGRVHAGGFSYDYVAVSAVEVRSTAPCVYYCPESDLDGETILRISTEVTPAFVLFGSYIWTDFNGGAFTHGLDFGMSYVMDPLPSVDAVISIAGLYTAEDSSNYASSRRAGLGARIGAAVRMRLASVLAVGLDWEYESLGYVSANSFGTGIELQPIQAVGIEAAVAVTEDTISRSVAIKVYWGGPDDAGR